jgi:hypothetical protein
MVHRCSKRASAMRTRSRRTHPPFAHRASAIITVTHTPTSPLLHMPPPSFHRCFRPPTPMTSSAASRTSTRPTSARRARCSAAARSSASPSRAPSCETPQFSCSVRRHIEVDIEVDVEVGVVLCTHGVDEVTFCNALYRLLVCASSCRVNARELIARPSHLLYQCQRSCASWRLAIDCAWPQAKLPIVTGALVASSPLVACRCTCSL